jgi:hypothetical protein
MYMLNHVYGREPTSLHDFSKITHVHGTSCHGIEVGITHSHDLQRLPFLKLVVDYAVVHAVPIIFG